MDIFVHILSSRYVQTLVKGKMMNWLVNGIYPLACPLCGKPTDQRKRVSNLSWQEYGAACSDCAEQVVPIQGIRCMKCGKEIGEEERVYCYDCMHVKHVYTQCIAALPYEKAIKQSIYRFKYKGCREYAWWYASIIAKYCLKQIQMWKPEIIIPVPMFHKKKKERGYNQAELVAEKLSLLTGIDMNSQILVRSRKTAPMKTLHGKERIKNLENAFLVKTKMIKYNKVLLIDDIYTTGATLDACSAALKKQGAEEVYAVCLCIGKGMGS